MLTVKHEFLYVLLAEGKINTFLSKHVTYWCLTRQFNWTTDCLVNNTVLLVNKTIWGFWKSISNWWITCEIEKVVSTGCTDFSFIYAGNWLVRNSCQISDMVCSEKHNFLDMSPIEYLGLCTQTTAMKSWLQITWPVSQYASLELRLLDNLCGIIKCGKQN